MKEPNKQHIEKRPSFQSSTASFDRGSKHIVANRITTKQYHGDIITKSLKQCTSSRYKRLSQPHPNNPIKIQKTNSNVPSPSVTSKHVPNYKAQTPGNIQWASCQRFDFHTHARIQRPSATEERPKIIKKRKICIQDKPQRHFIQATCSNLLDSALVRQR